MKQKVFFILFFINLFIFGQSENLETLKQKDDLENYLYQVLDLFLENPTEKNINHIESKLWRLPKTKNEQLAFVILNCNKGFYFNKFIQQTNAIDAYEKAWTLYNSNQLNGYDIVEYCLKPLGNLYTIIGDYQNAENTIKLYLYLSETENNQEQKVAALINLSVVYHNTGRFNEAVNILSPALDLKNINSLSEAKVLSNITTNYFSLKNDTKASEYLNKLKKILLVNNINDIPLKINAHKLLALIAVTNQDYNKAKIELKNVEKLIKSVDDYNARSIAKFYLEYATVLKEQNNLDVALNTIEKALQNLIPNYQKESFSIENLYAETTFIDVFDLLASIYTLKDDKETALNCYELSFKVEELLSNLYQYEETKLLQLNDNRVRSEKCMGLYYKLYKENGHNKYIDSAFILAEKTKAKILKETTIKKQKLYELKNDTLIVNQLSLEKQNSQIKTELIKEQLKGLNANVTYINQLINLQNKVNIKLKNVDNQIKKKYPNLQYTKKEININKLKEKLSTDNATMIEYFYGKGVLYCFTLNKNEIKFNRIEKIDDIILEYNKYFDDASKIVNDVTGYNLSAYNVYKSLNLSLVNESENLIIIPDGILNFTPFEALLTQKSESIYFNKLPYLINKHQILYHTSAEFYLYNTQRTYEKLNVLGVFPVFENSTQPLTYSIDEAESIKNLFSGNYLMYKDATSQNFIKSISEYSILHLSTHAHSGNYTTPASIQFYDEVVYPYQIYSLNINPKLIVLSACETGVGKTQKGEGVLSIARGFQFSGANNLLFSLWKVNDLSTSQLMGSFYKNYKKTGSGYISNHNAKLEYLKNEDIDNTKKSPYYWGSFVYYGNLESPNSNYSYYILIVTLVLILLLLLLKFKNAKSKKVLI